MFPVINRESVLSGFQWFFFIFCNTVVVPPTLLSAFHLPADNLLMLTQYAFLTTALACLVQAFCGHRRAIMEGPTGLWWGAILTITLGEASRGTPLNDIASSLSVGIAISAMVTIFIGISGLGHRLARLFTPAVMVFFMLLLGAQLTSIFFKGMLGLPFGIADTSARIKLAPLWAGGRGNVFYPRDDYFLAAAYLPLRVTGRDRGRVGAMAVMLSFVTLTAG
ncbi:purine permease ybbY [Salmonella enterica subsp. enterica]|nr:purine permease ybbY [Salmonella enterica subsp. enterica]